MLTIPTADPRESGSSFMPELRAALKPILNGTTEAEGVWAGLGATATLLQIADSSSSAANTTATPMIVAQTWRTVNQTLLPYNFATYRIGTSFGDSYSLYGLNRDTANYSTATPGIYNQIGMRSRVEMRQTNIPVGVSIYGYGHVFESIRHTAGNRAVAGYFQVENQSASDPVGDLSSNDTTAAIVCNASGINANGPGVYLEATDINTSFSTAFMPGPNSTRYYGIDFFEMTLTLSGTWASDGTTTLAGTSGKAIRQVVIGDMLIFNGVFYQVASTPASDNAIVLVSTVPAASGQTITKRTVPFRLANNTFIQSVGMDDSATYSILGLNRTNYLSIRAPAGFTFQSTDGLTTYAQLDTSTGHFGVGTSSPAFRMDVRSGGVITDGFTSKNIAWIGRTNTVEAGVIVGYHANGAVADYPVIRGGGATLGLALGGDLSTAAAVFIQASTGNVSIGTGTLQSSAYVSQTTAWAITAAGAADFRYIYTDELHAKSFIADLEQALAGGQIISKSVAELNSDFTLPAAGGAGTLVIKDLPSASGMAVFVSGDIVRLRQFSRAAGALTIADAWGVVSGFVNNGNGTQNWTFTRSTGGNAGTASGTINEKTLALDYGTTGNGFYEVNAIDGAYGVNSPYSQIVTWATHPQNGQTLRTRMGNLVGVTGATEYGLYAGDGGVAAANKFVRISDVNFEVHNIGLQLYESSTLAMSLQPSGPYFALGNPMPTSYLQASTSGIWMGHTGSSVYKMRVGTTSAGGALTAGWSWDNSVLTIIGSVTATAGTIGGFSIGADYVRDAADSFGLASTVTGGDDVRFWAGSTFANRATAPFRITESGAGSISGWSITSTDIRNSGATVMLRGAGNLAFGTVPPTSASVGTGLFGDSTGWTGLLSNVVQAKFDAATGAITAGGGKVLLNSTGIEIRSTSAASSYLNLYLSDVLTGSLRASATGTVMLAATLASASVINLVAQSNAGGSPLVDFDLRASSAGAFGVLWSESSNLSGLLITNGSPATAPTALLDVRGSAIFTGTLTAGSGPTTLTGATGKLLLAAVDVSVSSSGQVLTSTGTGTAPTWQSGSGGGANTALSNLASVAINANLEPASAGAVNVGSATFPFGHLFLGGSAPTMTLTDTTASAKSLTVAVDANLAQFRESAGAAGSLMVLDLANNRVGINAASPVANLTVGTLSTAMTTLLTGKPVVVSSVLGGTLMGVETTITSASTAGAFFGLYQNDGAALASGDRIGGFLFGGASSSSSLRSTVMVGAFASENWVDASAYGTDLRFETTAPGGTTRSAKVWILGNGNVGIGTGTFGTSAAGVLGIINGTAPSTSPADMIQIFSLDLSAGNASLGLRTETAVVTESVAQASTLMININGTWYKVLLSSAQS